MCELQAHPVMDENKKRENSPNRGLGGHFETAASKIPPLSGKKTKSVESFCSFSRNFFENSPKNGQSTLANDRNLSSKAKNCATYLHVTVY